MSRKGAPAEVHARQHLADFGAVRGAWRHDGSTCKLGDNGRGFAQQYAE